MLIGVAHREDGIVEVDKSTVQQNAILLASRGQYDKAIAEWTKLLADSSADGTTLNNIGDLHLKRKAPAEAVEAYFQAGAAFQAAGSTLKAIAVYKKILKVDPNNHKVYQHLGDLNAERGLVTTAVSDYSTLSQLYLKAGRIGDALAVNRKIVNLDPANLDAKRRLADLCIQENLREEAVKTYLQLGKECSAQKRPQEAQEAYHAVLRIDPDNARAQRLLNNPEEFSEDQPGGRTASTGGHSVMDMDRQQALDKANRQITDGLYEQADALLSELLGTHPGDPEVCRLLAMLHLKQGELAVAASEVQFLAEAAMRARHFEVAESMIQEYLNVDPSCVRLLELLAELHEQKGDGEVAAAHYGKAIEALLEHPDPEMPSRPIELYHKIATLAPTSQLVHQLGHILSPARSQPSDEQPVQPSPRPIEREPQVGESRENAAEATGPQPETLSGAPEAYRVSHKQEYRIRYELGLAYKDMGLLDEAMQEFRLALSGEDSFVDASIMLASCLKEKGLVEPAVECLEQALADSRCHGEHATSMRYELGVLCETAGMVQKTANIFSMIPTFLDVPMRLERLQGGERAASSGSEAQEPTDSESSPSDRASVAAGKTRAGDRKRRRISYL
jgi:tetratricopeptide (TPR) repeat protein